MGELLGQGLNWWLHTWWRAVAAQGAQTNCLHLCSPGDQEGWTQSGGPLGSYKSQPLKGEELLDLGCFLRRSAAQLREPLHLQGEFHSFCVWLYTCGYFACYCQEPVRSSFASLWAEWIFFITLLYFPSSYFFCINHPGQGVETWMNVHGLPGLQWVKKELSCAVYT